MNNTDPRQVLSRLPDDEFFGREAELAKVYSLVEQRLGGGGAAAGGAARARRPRFANALVLGPPRVGKTEILRKSYDRLFSAGSDAAPFYFAVKADSTSGEKFALEYLSQFLAQLAAFRRGDPRFIASAGEPLSAIARAFPPEDYLWARGLIDAYARSTQSGDPRLAVRCALSAPAVAGSRARMLPVILLDNFHLLAGSDEVRPELVRVLGGTAAMAVAADPLAEPVYVLCGLRRVITELMPADEDFFDRVEMLRVNSLAERHVDRLIRSTAERMAVEISDSTAELMIQQLDSDLFYVRALLDAAAAGGSGLKTFMDFERVYTDEVLGGRIGYYLGALMRDVAPEARARRAALEALALVFEASSPVPLDAVVERMAEHAGDAHRLLSRMHERELLEISYGFVTPSRDLVLADYVRARYRSEIAGVRRPLAGEELLSEKLKDSYKLMMSRFNRAVETQLVEMLTRFDFQNAPASLFDHTAYDKLYRGMGRAQARRALDEEQERVRLPQVVLVNNLGAASLPGIDCRLIAASGFEGGIYSEANEVVWLIALVNAKEPLDVETLNHIEQRLESSARAGRGRANSHTRTVRWYICKEGFSAVATERLSGSHAYYSTYAQLDHLSDFLASLNAPPGQRRPISEFELVIPVEHDAELIAARTVEQIARAVDFEQDSINQIKTALIEACINAAEHGDSPDRRIHQRFAVQDDRLVITVSNKGNAFTPLNGEHDRAEEPATPKAARGRGLQIIRALMDEVRFERTDDGASLVMTKLLKRPGTEE